MSGETADAPLGWTPDLLRIYVERVLAEMDHRYEDRFAAQEKAITKTETATEKRFESVNELRGQLNDVIHTLMPRSESEALHHRTGERLDDLSQRTTASFGSIGSRLDLMTGRAAGSNVEARLEAISKQIDTNSATIITEGARGIGAREAVTDRRQNNAALYATIGVCIAVLSFLMAVGGYLAGKP